MRRNRGNLNITRLTRRALGKHDAGRRFKDWHWGIPHNRVIDWDEEDYPEHAIVEAGRLTELHVRQPGDTRKTRIRLNRREMNNSHVAFDPLHDYQRLYLFADSGFRRRLKATYVENPQWQPLDLNEMAAQLKGRHATRDYPHVLCYPVGILTDIVYTTDKKGDGMSHYIHEFGEESGIRPVLAVDAKGRPWVVGGNYTCPDPGITD